MRILVFACLLFLPDWSFAAGKVGPAMTLQITGNPGVTVRQVSCWKKWCSGFGTAASADYFTAVQKSVTAGFNALNEEMLEWLGQATVAREGTQQAKADAVSTAVGNAGKAREEHKLAREQFERSGRTVLFEACGFSPGTALVGERVEAARLQALLAMDMSNLYNATDKKPLITGELLGLRLGKAQDVERFGSFFPDYPLFDDNQWRAWNSLRAVMFGTPALKLKDGEAGILQRNQVRQLVTLMDKPFREFGVDRRATIPFGPLRSWLGREIATPYVMPMTANPDGSINLVRAKGMTETEIREYVDKVKQDIIAKNGGQPLSSEQSALIDAYSRQYLGTKYSMNGPRDPSKGSTDCSGFVYHQLSSLGYFGGGTAPTAASMTKNLTSKVGTTNTAGLAPGNLSGNTYVIGVASPGDARVADRWNGVGHIVTAYRDPATGKMLVSESTGSKGVIITPYEKWYNRQIQQGRTLYGADMTRELDAAVKGYPQTDVADRQPVTVETEGVVYDQDTNLSISRELLLRFIGERYMAPEYHAMMAKTDERNLYLELSKLESFVYHVWMEIREDMKFGNILDALVVRSRQKDGRAALAGEVM